METCRNRIFGLYTTLTSLWSQRDSFRAAVSRGDESAMVPFMVTHNEEIIGFFVPANNTQAFYALAGQILPELDIYRNFPAVQQLMDGNPTSSTGPQDA